METCRKTQEKLLNHNPSTQDEIEVKSHLNACADCRQAAEENLRVATLLRQFHAPMLPNSFDAGLQSKLAAAQARQEQSNAITHWFTRTTLAVSLTPRRALGALGLGTSLAAAAAFVGGFLLMPHIGGGSASQGSYSGGQGVLLPQTQNIAPLPSTLQQGDAEFIAACSSQNAQYASTQSVADPSANALAASLDSNRAAPENSNTSDASNPPAD